MKSVSQAGAAFAIGIDLGGSSIKAVTVQPNGQTKAQANLSFDASAKMDWAGKVREVVQKILRDRDAAPRAIGLSAPGLAADDGKSIAYMPGRLQGLEGLNWKEHLRVNKSVPVLNDGHAALLGEAWLGAGKGYRNVIMITLGTGVGGAAIVDGKLLRGHLGRAGHLGHISLDPDAASDICGAPGSLELAIGNCTIMERSHGRFETTHDLILAHEQGDAEATLVWLKSVKALAAAVTSFVNVLDPEAVIIGGGIGRAGKTLLVPLERYLRSMEWQPGGRKVKLLPAQLGEFAGAIGAAYHALCQTAVKRDDAMWRIDFVPYVHQVK